MSSQPDGFNQKHANLHDTCVCVCVCIMLSICLLISDSFYFAPTKIAKSGRIIESFLGCPAQSRQMVADWSWGLRMGAVASGDEN